MITIRIAPPFLLSILTQGRTVNPLRVRAGLPENCMMVGCRFDDRRNLVLMDFADGQPGSREIEVIYDVGVPTIRTLHESRMTS